MADAVLGDDGLPMTKVGAWTLEKHERLVRYVTITRAVRRMFAKTQTTYIELFCGPGRSVIEESSEIIDGSPVLATRTAKDSGFPYTDIYLADFEAAFVEAACRRLLSNVGRVHPAIGAAENTVDQIIKNLNPAGLHFAFLDPYKLDPLPFSVIKKLAKLKRMDILIHVSVQDFQRNLRRYMEEKGGPLDRFAPGWRSVVNDQEADRKVRMAIFQHWLSLIRALDMAPSEGIERVVGSRRQPLYWLVLVSRHNRAQEFWEKIRNVSPQGRLNL